MSKRIRKIKRHYEKVIIGGIFLFSWFTTTVDFIRENPSDMSTGLFLIFFPFLIAMAFKPFRKMLFKVVMLFIKSFRHKGMLPIDIREVDNMSGLEFEQFLKPIFERQGYMVNVTQGSGDYGADLLLRKGFKKYVLQAKRYSGNIGISAVQQVVAAVNYYNAQGAIVVTNQYFTKAAVQLAKANNVDLIDRERLGRMIRL